MQVEVKDITGKTVKSLDLSPDVVSSEHNEHVLHLAVKAYQANRRQGTHATKTRSLVSGGGKKPFKQKGTGGARQGTTRGPHMPGGAVVHGPQPRSYRQKLNRKAKSLALKVALRDKLENKQLIVLNDFGLSTFSTKHVCGLLKNFKVSSALLVDERKDSYLARSAANIYKVDAMNPGALNAEHLLAHTAVMITEKALGVLTARLTKGEA